MAEHDVVDLYPDSSPSTEWPRKQVLSLQILSHIAVIKQVHRYASRLEKEYMETWLETQLSPTNKELEATINIRSPDVDTEAVVLKYKAIEAETVRKKLEDMQRKKNSGPKMKRGRNRRQQRAATAPYLLPQGKSDGEEKLLTSLKPKIVHGIPEGVEVRDYIEYRKCKYIEDIKRVRNVLTKALNSSVLNDMMSVMFNIAQFNNKHEHGLLTLQAMLMTKHTNDFRIASAKFHRNFATSSHYQMKEQMANIETRIGTTILHYTLLDGSSLTQVSLENCSCDSVLKVISDAATNLRYLNISGSVVSDQGLLHLCGVEKGNGRQRPKLARQCKEKYAPQERLVVNEMPIWERKREGCRRLEHFIGQNLKRLNWSGQSMMKYYDHPNVPIDAAFVAMLEFMPCLTVFVIDVGGRAVQSWTKYRSKKKVKAKSQLKLEVVSESRLTPPLLDLVNEVCPNLRQLKVEWYDFFMHQQYSREDWCRRLQNCKRLRSLHVADIDFKTPTLQQALVSAGSNLTELKLREVWTFRYSNFRAIKKYCPNLVVLHMAMTSVNVITTINHISVDKDHNLQLHGQNDLSCLKNLMEFYLIGPFEHEIVSYLLKGADGLKRLTLGIEWLDPTFCDNQPMNRKDLIGPEYLKEVMTVNRMKELEEIHLLAQYRRGRSRLVTSCADLILAQFPKIRHIGNFQYWNITPNDIMTLMAKVRSTNRDITFDEDLHTNSYENPVFEYRYIPGRNLLSCKQITLKKDSSNILTDFFDVLAGPPALLDDDVASEDDAASDGGNSDDDFSIDLDQAESDDDDDDADEPVGDLFQVGGNNVFNEEDDGFNEELEPACAVM